MAPTDVAELESRISVLEQKDEVRALLARYCELNDALTRLDELLALFAEDAVLVNPSGEHRGRAAIERYYRGFFDGTTEFARHHILNPVIEIPQPGRATVTAYFIALLGREGASRIALGRYEDELVRAEGAWRFLRKGNHVLGVTTAEAGWARGFVDGAPAGV